MLKKFLIFCAASVSLTAISVVAAYYGLVVFSSGKMDPENIQGILSRQSPVYYSGGEDVLGVFFRDSHRLYVPYERIPKDFVNAIVAAEDHEFFSHSGVDVPGIIRAFIANIKARRIVQGGSTITQQTAKNLFKRKERSLKAKLKELLYALRLEHHYTKEEILTFYANQFYVSGNGRGLGMAARYYFDKNVDDLTLVECAFIAGSVKGPNYYNPFTKSNPEGKEAARRKAEKRTSYVLSQMHNLGMVDTIDYQRALGPVPFNKGRMRYPLNTVMDMVEEGLNTDLVRQALARHGIDNVATSGISIITTIDKEIQKTVVRSLRNTLSRLDIRLSGYERDEVQRSYSGLSMVNMDTPQKGDLMMGRVVGIEKNGPPRIEVNLSGGREGGRIGVIGKEGLRPALTALVRYHRQRWSEPRESDWPLLLDQIREGDLVYVSVQGHDEETDKYELVLKKYPELQGGALVVRDGMIRGLIGGYDNFYYNRAVQARRPMGSTFKAPLYTAAIQLGWNSLDLLDNRRRAFVYQKNAYIPKPDHYSPHDKVSLAWAGVNSENVASIWLLYNLCDRLTPSQFKDLLQQLGLARKTGESYFQYSRRMRDRKGIVVDDRTLERTAFTNAISNCRADLAFAGREDDLPLLERFVYSDQFIELDENATGHEAEIKREIAGYNFERFRKLKNLLEQTAEELSGAVPASLFAGDPGKAEISAANLYIRQSPIRGVLFGNEYMETLARADYVFTPEEPGDGWEPVRRREFSGFLAQLDKRDRDSFWSSVKLDNLLSVETVNIVENCMQEELKRLKRYRRYSPEVLYSVPDFRVLAGLEYVIGLCRTAGVSSDLKPVLSFPLGSNVVSLYELSRIYEGLLTGEVKEYASANAGLALISRIMAPNGDVIYSADPETRVIADSRTILEVSEILKNVVSHGTGRYADRLVKIRGNASSSRGAKLLTGDLRVPLFGKTGTADNYTNSVFVGAVPGLADTGKATSTGSSSTGKTNGVNLEEPDIIGVYLGYDDNRPMIRTSTHITGASGALRVWTRIAMDIVDRKDYVDNLDLVDLAFAGAERLPFIYPDLGQIHVPVSRENGIPLVGTGSSGSGGESVATFGEMDNNGKGLQLDRYYRPYWR